MRAGAGLLAQFVEQVGHRVASARALLLGSDLGTGT
jgi:hypothetical protein